MNENSLLTEAIQGQMSFYSTFIIAKKFIFLGEISMAPCLRTHKLLVENL